MARGWLNPKLIACLVAAIAAIFPVLDLIPATRGLLPLFHVLSPYGFEEKDIPDLTHKHFLVTGANVSRFDAPGFESEY